MTPFNQEQLDVIFMDEAFSDQLHGQIFSNTLYEEPYYVVGQTAVLQSISASMVTPKDLQQLQLLMYPQYCPIHSRIVQIFRKLGLSLPEIHEVDYSEALIKLIMTSQFVTILPESLMHKNVSTIKNLDAKKLSIDFIRKVAVFSHNPRLTFQFKSMLQKI
ncbi:LysR substrate-binding domain-containing protein [Ligilactobacillus sp. LYQ60]|uniref:LysR substrate-binding domain-containing protein n=1 Tax=Ligilactobacillus sp. LYQ60 TaxID=3378799 RepID=UPI00385566B7